MCGSGSVAVAGDIRNVQILVFYPTGDGEVHARRVVIVEIEYHQGSALCSLVLGKQGRLPEHLVVALARADVLFKSKTGNRRFALAS